MENTDPKILPNELHELFALLHEEVITLNVRWKLFKQLYGTNPQRVELMRLTANDFFWHLQPILLDHSILLICRLTDPARVSSNYTLALAQLVAKARRAGLGQLSYELEEALCFVKALAKPLRHHRDKRVAHLDMSFKVGEELLPGISRKSVDDVVIAIGIFMNKFRQAAALPLEGYDRVVTLRDGNSLVLAMKKGLEYDALLQEDAAKWLARLDSSRFAGA